MVWGKVRWRLLANEDRSTRAVGSGKHFESVICIQMDTHG